MVGCFIFAVGGILQTAGPSLDYQYAGRFLAASLASGDMLSACMFLGLTSDMTL